MMPSPTNDFQPGTRVARFTVLRELEPDRNGRMFELRCVICKDVVKARRMRLVRKVYPRCSCNRSGGNGTEE